MIPFLYGVVFGFVVGLILVRSLQNKGDGRWSNRTSTGAHRSHATFIRKVVGPKKIDGIWEAKEERHKKSVDPSRPRVRKAVILERSRRG